jgi:hypothetical protein
LPKICQKSGQAHPDAREMFRAFFVAAGAKRKASPYNMPVYPGALRIAVIRWVRRAYNERSERNREDRT